MGQLKIIHYALLAGQLLFAGVVYFLISGESPYGQDSFLIPVAAMAIGGSAASFFIYQTLVSKGKSQQGDEDKMTSYRTAKIVQWALLEGPSLFACVAALVTKDQFFLYFTLGLALFSFVRSASQTEFERDLN